MTGLCALVAIAALAPVELRGGAVLREPVLQVSAEGVLLGGDAPRIIGWDRAKVVTGEFADAASAYEPVADKAWRARARLARGDFALAEPLFEELFATYHDSSGPTSLVVAEGLMRCRVARGDTHGALEAWLAALRLRRDGFRLVGEPPLPPMIDDETGLVATLPPIFERDARRPAGAIDLALEGDVAALASWYEAALSGGDAPSVSAPDSPAGLALVANIVLAQRDEPAQRGPARAWLEAELTSHGSPGDWREAWMRCALGLSLLAGEPGEDDVERGLLQLAHLPARFSAEHAKLASVALRAMIESYEARGDGKRARALTEDLRAIDPDNSALAAIGGAME